nr:immunoglobulin heavy chain junction region [Mus musculus]
CAYYYGSRYWYFDVW